MRMFSLSIRNDSTKAGPYVEWVASPTKPMVVSSIRVVSAGTRVAAFALGRPEEAGVSNVDAVLFDALDHFGYVGAQDGSLASAYVDWEAQTEDDPTPVAPTAPSSGAYLRRCVTPATAGTGFNWAFGAGLVVPAGGSLVLFASGAKTDADITLVMGEP